MQEKIYYVVEAKINAYDLENNFRQNVKTVKQVFRNDEPKKIRKKAFLYFEKFRNEYFVQRIKNVVLKSELKVGNYPVSLRISFGLKQSIGCEEISLFPIGAIGNLLHLVEKFLKANLVLERNIYVLYKFTEPKVQKEKYFLESNVLLNATNIMNIYNSLDSEIIFSRIISDIRSERGEETYEYFKTPQFYKIKTNGNENRSEKLFFSKIRHQSDFITTQNIKKYKKELQILSDLYGLNKGHCFKVGMISIEEVKLLLDFAHQRNYLFTQKQQFLHSEISEYIKFSPTPSWRRRLQLNEWI